MSIEAMKRVVEAFDALPPDHPARYANLQINLLRTAIQQATQPAEVTDDQIESCALEAGFSVESTGSIWAVDGYVGTRVDPGLRKFARAILAMRPERVPMDKQDAWDNSPVNSDWEAVYAYLQGIEDAEAHHGVTAQAKKETP